MEGVPLKVIAEMAGHKTTDLIESHYGHLSQNITYQASKTFASLLNDDT